MNRKDEAPNISLAAELISENNLQGIREIAQNLWNTNHLIQGDCIKVLYEIGYQKPELIAEYYKDFIKLLYSRVNRLVWGGMIALSTLAHLRPDQLFSEANRIKKTMESGSVITVDAGVKTLAKIAAANKDYAGVIMPYLLDHLRTCRTKEVPQHAESILTAIRGDYVEPFRRVLVERREAMTPPQVKRIELILKRLQ